MALIAAGLPRYSSYYSNHVYDDHAKVSLLVLRQHLDVSYEEMTDMLGSVSGVIKALKIRSIPDPSTLRKFVKRLDPDVLDKVLWHTAKAVCNEQLIVAVNATGFSCSNASRHYARRLRELKEMTYSEAPVREYEKMTIAVDTSTLSILTADSCPSNISDYKRIGPIAEIWRSPDTM